MVRELELAPAHGGQRGRGPGAGAGDVDHDLLAVLGVRDAEAVELVADGSHAVVECCQFSAGHELEGVVL